MSEPNETSETKKPEENKNGVENSNENGVEIDFQLPPQPTLDRHLALIEEQFRKGFDERYKSSITRTCYEDPEETLRCNKIFREVSKRLGADWRKVYDDLMKKYSKEVIEQELQKISKSQPIIQGYKALMSWKEITGPKEFTLMTLVQSLNDLQMPEISDVVIHIIDNNEVPEDKGANNRKRMDIKPDATSLDNRKLLLISKKVGGAYEALGVQLGVSEEEIKEIKEQEGDSYQGCFKILWAWKEERKEDGKGDVEVLKEALSKCGLSHALEGV